MVPIFPKRFVFSLVLIPVLFSKLNCFESMGRHGLGAFIYACILSIIAHEFARLGLRSLQ